MKRASYAILLITVLLIASCKKNDTSSIGSWSFDGVKYNASGLVYSAADSTLTVSSGGGTLTFYFPSAALPDGSYRVVSYDSIPLAPGTTYIRFINTATSQYYFSTGTDNITAKVSILASGKISASVPAVYLESYFNPVSETAQLSAQLSQ